MPHFDAAWTRWSVHWHMIGAQESFVEIVLLEFPQFCLELVLQSHHESRHQTSAPSTSIQRTSSISSPRLAVVDIVSELSLATSRCSLMEFIVASTLSMVLENPESRNRRKDAQQEMEMGGERDGYPTRTIVS